MKGGATSGFRFDIEGLRAVAVLLVLFHHAGLAPSGGYIGVDVFFVISGYLITGLLIRETEKTGTVSLLQFYARRARRLLPAASLVLVSTLVLTRLFAPAVDRDVFSTDVAAAAAYLANWKFAARSVDYLAEDVGRSPALHFWSLGVEEQFYFIWPLLILAALKGAQLFRVRPRVALSLALGLVLLPSFAWSVSFTETASSPAFFVTTTRLWELSVGAFFALIRPERVPRGLSNVGAWLGFVLIASASLHFDRTTHWPGYQALAPVAGTAFLLISGARCRDSFWTRILSQRPLVWIGGLSYSLYLWHWPLVVLVQDWWGKEGPLWGSCAVFVSVVPAWLCHRYIEQPLRFSPALRALPRRSLALGGLLSLSVFGLALAPRLLGEAQQLDESFQLRPRAGRVLVVGERKGALLLGRHPERSSAARRRPVYSEYTPSAEAAPKDIPEAYPKGCQAKFEGTEPNWCEIGDPAGGIEVAMVGDSKILQYYHAFDAVGRALGWKIRTATKSSCPFTAARKRRAGSIYEECAVFNERVLSDLLRRPPGIVLTSQGEEAGFLARAPSKSAKPTRAQMVEGLVDYWAQLTATGSQVLVILDNPRPPKDVRPIYQCLVDNPTNHQACSFERESASRESAAKVQKRAVRRVSGAHALDLGPYICPGDVCAPVIGGVLVYRQGAHITNTYARSLAPTLLKEIQLLKLKIKAD